MAVEIELIGKFVFTEATSLVSAIEAPSAGVTEWSLLSTGVCLQNIYNSAYFTGGKNTFPRTYWLIIYGMFLKIIEIKCWKRRSEHVQCEQISVKFRG